MARKLNLQKGLAGQGRAAPTNRRPAEVFSWTSGRTRRSDPGSAALPGRRHQPELHSRPGPSTTSRSRTAARCSIASPRPEVRRVNLIVYANYGEPNARIIHGRDHDFPDLRTHEHNETSSSPASRSWRAEARRGHRGEGAASRSLRIKGLIREYYLTKTEKAKREFEEANALFPFLFSRAWSELKRRRRRPSAAETRIASEDVLYPLDAALRERVIDIERLIDEIGQDLQRLKAAGQGRRHPDADLPEAGRPGPGGAWPGGRVGVQGPPAGHDPEQPDHHLAADPGSRSSSPKNTFAVVSGIPLATNRRRRFTQ